VATRKDCGGGDSLGRKDMSLAGTYKMFRSRRPHKDSMSASHTEQVIIAERGKHFDPLRLNSFIRIKEQFANIHKELRNWPEIKPNNRSHPSHPTVLGHTPLALPKTGPPFAVSPNLLLDYRMLIDSKRLTGKPCIRLLSERNLVV